MNGLFLTGTDTGVGKTVLTATLALGLRARGLEIGVAKPIQTGALAADPEGDAAVLKRWLGLTESLEEICPFSFSPPVAPLIAAKLEARELALDDVVDAVTALEDRYEAVLVEGVGGLLVPVGPGWNVSDLAEALGLHLVVVARPGLGTVNHTLLTLEAARARGLRVAGVILNGRRDQHDASLERNADLITSLGEVRVIGQTPWVEGSLTSERLAKLAAVNIVLDPLLSVLKDASRA